MSKHAVRACLIVNPRSGGGGVDLSEALLVLAANRWEAEIRQKLHKGYAVKLAREAAHEGFDVVVGNTRRYGGFTRMTADAYIDDGLLDVCFITTGGVVDATRQSASLVLRQRPSHVSAEIYRAEKVTVFAPSAMPFQLDGGAIEQDEIDVNTDGVVYEFSVLPRAVSVLVPKTYDRELLESGSLHASEHSLNGKAGKGKHKKHKKG